MMKSSIGFIKTLTVPEVYDQYVKTFKTGKSIDYGNVFHKNYNIPSRLSCHDNIENISKIICKKNIKFAPQHEKYIVHVVR